MIAKKRIEEPPTQGVNLERKVEVPNRSRYGTLGSLGGEKTPTLAFRKVRVGYLLFKQARCFSGEAPLLRGSGAPVFRSARERWRWSRLGSPGSVGDLI